MKEDLDNISEEHLNTPFNDLNASEKDVVESIVKAEPIAEDVNIVFHEQLSFGQRLADKVAAFGGSWTFIVIFLSILLSWMVINSIFLAGPKEAFDPYPYILLNLVLSTTAALQAPIIMMSQNRQAAKDRIEISENYRVSLKTDLEIMRLHNKIEELTKAIDKLK